MRSRRNFCLETEGALSADRAPQATFQCDGLAATETPGDPAEDVAHRQSGFWLNGSVENGNEPKNQYESALLQSS
jgi:hypothetical protein